MGSGMFKIISSTILFIALAIQTFHMGGLVMDYYLNTSAYSKNCENKAIPILKCNGKCQLAKKILAKQEQEQQTPESKLENKLDVFCLKSSFTLIPPHKISYPDTYRLYPEAMISSSHVSAIFHPPCVV